MPTSTSLQSIVQDRRDCAVGAAEAISPNQEVESSDSHQLQSDTKNKPHETLRGFELKGRYRWIARLVIHRHLLADGILIDKAGRVRPVGKSNRAGCVRPASCRSGSVLISDYGLSTGCAHRDVPAVTMLRGVISDLLTFGDEDYPRR